MTTLPKHKPYLVPLIFNSTRSLCSDSARFTPPMGLLADSATATNCNAFSGLQTWSPRRDLPILSSLCPYKPLTNHTSNTPTYRPPELSLRDPLWALVSEHHPEQFVTTAGRQLNPGNNSIYRRGMFLTKRRRVCEIHNRVSLDIHAESTRTLQKWNRAPSKGKLRDGVGLTRWGRLVGFKTGGSASPFDGIWGIDEACS